MLHIHFCKQYTRMLYLRCFILVYQPIDFLPILESCMNHQRSSLDLGPFLSRPHVCYRQWTSNVYCRCWRRAGWEICYIFPPCLKLMNKTQYIFEPPVSDDPNCEDLVVAAYWRTGRFRNQLQTTGGSLRSQFPSRHLLLDKEFST